MGEKSRVERLASSSIGLGRDVFRWTSWQVFDKTMAAAELSLRGLLVSRTVVDEVFYGSRAAEYAAEDQPPRKVYDIMQEMADERNPDARGAQAVEVFERLRRVGRMTSTLRRTREPDTESYATQTEQLLRVVLSGEETFDAMGFVRARVESLKPPKPQS